MKYKAIYNIMSKLFEFIMQQNELYIDNKCFKLDINSYGDWNLSCEFYKDFHKNMDEFGEFILPTKYRDDRRIPASIESINLIDVLNELTVEIDDKTFNKVMDILLVSSQDVSQILNKSFKNFKILSIDGNFTYATAECCDDIYVSFIYTTS